MLAGARGATLVMPSIERSITVPTTIHLHSMVALMSTRARLMLQTVQPNKATFLNAKCGVFLTRRVSEGGPMTRFLAHALGWEVSRGTLFGS